MFKFVEVPFRYSNYLIEFNLKKIILKNMQKKLIIPKAAYDSDKKFHINFSCENPHAMCIFVSSSLVRPRGF